MIFVAFINVVVGLSQWFDLYSDIAVLYTVYYSFRPDNVENHDHLLVALIILFLALASTFMATQSCIIGIKFS